MNNTQNISNVMSIISKLKQYDLDPTDPKILENYILTRQNMATESNIKSIFATDFLYLYIYNLVRCWYYLIVNICVKYTIDNESNICLLMSNICQRFSHIEFLNHTYVLAIYHMRCSP